MSERIKSELESAFGWMLDELRRMGGYPPGYVFPEVTQEVAGTMSPEDRAGAFAVAGSCLAAILEDVTENGGGWSGNDIQSVLAGLRAVIPVGDEFPTNMVNTADPDNGAASLVDRLVDSNADVSDIDARRAFQLGQVLGVDAVSACLFGTNTGTAEEYRDECFGGNDAAIADQLRALLEALRGAKSSSSDDDAAVDPEAAIG